MKRTRKILCIVLVVAFVLMAALTGCGSSTSSTSAVTSTPASSDVAASSATKALDPYEVKWYFVGTKDYDGKTAVQDKLAEGLKDINTTLKLQVFPWGDYPNKMSMIIASGEQFDICFMGAWTNYYQNVAKGAFVDLTDLVATNLPNFSKVIDPAFLEAPKVKGRLYGLPTNKETFASYGVEVDKNLATTAGVSFDGVKAYADLEPILTAAKAKLPKDTFPMTFQSTSYFKTSDWDELGDWTIPGFVKVGEDKTVVDQFESPEFMANWQLAYKWTQAGLANKNGATKGAPDYWNQEKGMCRAESLGPVGAYMGSKNNEIDRVRMGNNIVTTGSGAGALQCFSKTSKDVNRALLFFDTVATNPDLYNLLMFGIEGRDYQVTDATTDPKTVAFLSGQDENSVAYIHAGGAWSLGMDWFASYLSGADPKDRNAQVKALNAAAAKSPLLGFSFDATPVKTEVDACGTVYQELGVPLNCGAVDPAVAAPKFIEKLKAAGVDKIIAEKQAQLNQWKTDNGK
jgi:putative aldouronate transport system substrate-binding protein